MPGSRRGWDAPVAAHVAAPGTLERRELVLVLVAIWALRLAVYITARNWGRPEDYRYQAIRRRNDPGFTFKSLSLVFGLQALLAWVISLPLLGAILGIRPLGPLDAAGAALWHSSVTLIGGTSSSIASSLPAARTFVSFFSRIGLTTRSLSRRWSRRSCLRTLGRRARRTCAALLERAQRVGDGLAGSRRDEHAVRGARDLALTRS